MTTSNVSASLASAMAAATLASQQAAQYAAATDAAAAVSGLQPIPLQHWELLRVAELLSTGFAAAQPAPKMSPPPLFLPTLPGQLSVPMALPKPPPPITVPSAPIIGSGLPVGAVQLSGGVPVSAGLQYMLASANCAAAAAKAAAAAAISPVHAEPQTPELTPAGLRSPSFPAPATIAAATAAMALHAPAAVPASSVDRTPTPTVVARPVAVRPVLAPGAGIAPKPMSAFAPPPPRQSSPPAGLVSSPGAAFSLVKRAVVSPPPQQQAPAPPQRSPEPEAKPTPVPQPQTAKPTSPTVPRAAFPSPSLSPRAGGVRKRRGGSGSPVKRKAGSPDSAMTEGCGESVMSEGGHAEEEPQRGYKGRFCGRLFLKEDEKKLAAECEALGPLVGFPGPGKRGHCTVAKLARAIVAGSVRRICAARDAEIQELRAQLTGRRAQDDAELHRLQLENAAMRAELALRK